MPIPHLIAGTTREHYIMLFSAAGAVALLAGFAGAWIGSLLGARRAVRAIERTTAARDAAVLELAPVIQALDAIAVEVERISEAQRFTTKVLAERPGAALPRSEVRTITPH